MNPDRIAFVIILTPAFTGLLYAAVSDDRLTGAGIIGLSVTAVLAALGLIIARIKRGRWPRDGEPLL